MVKAFIELVRSHQRPDMVVAEIGCYDGESAQHWLPIVADNHGSAVLVDHFKGSPAVTVGDIHHEASCNGPSVLSALMNRIRGLDRITLLIGDSAAMSQSIPDRLLDLCFIDADHRYSRVSADIDAWRPKVKPGGILCGHDCESLMFNPDYIERDYIAGNHHGVAKAVSERFPNVMLMGDAVWAVQL